MNAQEILKAVGVLNEVAEAFGGMPEDRKEALIASLHCHLVSTYLIDLAKHLQDGMEPYDACLEAISGKASLSDLGVRESIITTFQLLTAKPTK